MCGGLHYGEVEGLVSVERWSCSRGASCVVEYQTMLYTGQHAKHNIDLPIRLNQTSQAFLE